MTKREIGELMTILQANYPDSFRGQSEAVVGAKVKLWHDMFKDYPSPVVYAAAKAFMATDVKGFMPSVGQIMEKIQLMKQPNEMTPGEAWHLVYKAIRNSTYWSVEEFAKLPDQVQRFVGSPEQLRDWALMDAETVQSVIGSNFQRSFKVRQINDRDFDKLPEDIKAFVGRIATSSVGMLEAGGPEKGEKYEYCN